MGQDDFHLLAKSHSIFTSSFLLNLSCFHCRLDSVTVHFLAFLFHGLEYVEALEWM